MLYFLVALYAILSAIVSCLLWMIAPYDWRTPAVLVVAWLLVSAGCLYAAWHTEGFPALLLSVLFGIFIAANAWPTIFAINMYSEIQGAENSYGEGVVKRGELGKKFLERGTPITSADMTDYFMILQYQRDGWHEKPEDTGALYKEWEEFLKRKLLDPNLELTVMESTTQPLFHYVLNRWQTFPRLHQLLLEYGADPEVRNAEGDTALLQFAKDSNYSGSGGPETLKYLLGCGLNLNATGNEKRTAADFIERGRFPDMEMGGEFTYEELYAEPLAILAEAKKNPKPPMSCKIH